MYVLYEVCEVYRVHELYEVYGLYEVCKVYQEYIIEGKRGIIL